MEMPNYLDWEKIGQMNPMANSMAMTQAGLAQNFQQGVQDKQAADLVHQNLANDFDKSNNPTRLQQGLATLDTSNIANRKGRIEADISEATAPQQLQAAQGKLRNTLSTQDLVDITNGAWKDATSLDPVTQKKGYALLSNLEQFVKMRQEHDNKMAEDVPRRLSAEKIAAGHDATQLEIARMREKQQANRGKVIGTIDQQIAQAKTHIHRGNIYTSAAATLRESDPELANFYAQQAREAYQLARDDRAAGVAAGAAGKPNLPQMGIPTNPAPAPIAVSPLPPVPGVGGTQIGPGGRAPVPTAPKVIKLD